MLVCKTRSLLKSAAPERLARDKHSSLFGQFVNYSCKNSSVGLITTVTSTVSFDYTNYFLAVMKRSRLLFLDISGLLLI
jgi:hypothetical protein